MRSAAARSRASGIASGSAPRSNRWDASVCIPSRRDVRRIATGSHHAASRRTFFVRFGDGRVEPSHDAGQRHRALRVGDDDVRGLERSLDSVQRDELLAAARLAHDDPPAARACRGRTRGAAGPGPTGRSSWRPRRRRSACLRSLRVGVRIRFGDGTLRIPRMTRAPNRRHSRGTSTWMDASSATGGPLGLGRLPIRRRRLERAGRPSRRPRERGRGGSSRPAGWA